MTALNKRARQVQRYTNYGVDMMEWADGGYVRHSDYLALLDELEAAEKRNAELEGLALENIRLKVGISGLIGLGLRYADADVMRLAADAQQSTPITDGIIENIAAGIGVKGE